MGLLDALNPLNAITGALTHAYEVHANAKNDKDRIAAEVEIEELKARRDVVIAASVNDRWWSPRTLMGWSVAIYVAKIIVWDTVLGLGITPNPGVIVGDIVKVVIGFYFLAKGAETVANTIAGAIGRRR